MQSVNAHETYEQVVYSGVTQYSCTECVHNVISYRWLQCTMHWIYKTTLRNDSHTMS